MSKGYQYKKYTRSKFGSFVYFVFLVLAGSFSVLPLIYCVTTAFKPLDELLVYPPRFFVRRPTLTNFVEIPALLGKMSVPVTRYFLNSLFITFVSTLLQIIFASMAAYVLSKSKIKFKAVFFLIVQFSLLYNGTTLAIPQYLILSNLRLIDSIWVYILPTLASTTGVFLIKQFIDASIPDALLEAARIDGASPFRIYLSVVMPNIKPAWMTILLFAFQGVWSISPASGTIYSEELKTLPYVMSSIASGGLARQGSAMACTVLLLLPPVIVYFVTQSNVMQTMSSAGIKE